MTGEKKIMHTPGVNSAAWHSYCQVIYNDWDGLRNIKKFYSLPN